MFKKNEVVLQRSTSKKGSITVTAKIIDSGDLRIDGHDLTSQGKNLFGTTEVEWIIIVTANHIPAFQSALESEAPILTSLKTRFSDQNTAKIKPFLDEQGIPYKFSNRIGD